VQRSDVNKATQYKAKGRHSKAKVKAKALGGKAIARPRLRAQDQGEKFWALCEGLTSLVRATPGEVDGGPLPSAECLGHPSPYNLASKLCTLIAAETDFS